jgi:hypothetical protein
MNKKDLIALLDAQLAFHLKQPKARSEVLSGKAKIKAGKKAKEHGGRVRLGK